ncbi:MAG: hypothetical protein ABI624_08900 [Casimicrobiaceae bacterium]
MSFSIVQGASRQNAHALALLPTHVNADLAALPPAVERSYSENVDVSMSVRTLHVEFAMLSPFNGPSQAQFTSVALPGIALHFADEHNA